ncbi:MAG: hypothetical protein IPH08_03840 [Rhodocyclaceae bacterium]|nr:hypothetical protein [Rhodocyclaceae bacterium]
MKITEAAKAAADRLLAENEETHWESLENGCCLILKPYGWMITKLTDGPDDPEPLWAIWEPREAFALALGMYPAEAKGFDEAGDAKRFCLLLATTVAVFEGLESPYDDGDVVMYIEKTIVGAPIFLNRHGSPVSVLGHAVEGDEDEIPEGEQ